ncbi:MAG: DUF87 domain-containing protein [Desulfurococcaceae archaeon]
MIKVGFIHGWENDIVNIVVTDTRYIPSLGDLLYVHEKTINGMRTLLLEVVGYASQSPRIAIPIDTQSPMGHLELVTMVKGRLFLEISRGDNDELILTKATRPPMPMNNVYLIRKGDMESEEIIRSISQYSFSKRQGSSSGIGVVVLRSGVAHNELLAREKYFMNAVFKLDLPEILRKHVLIVGQTGSGKTSGLQGILVKYALESSEKIGWLVVDRHGEYSTPEGYIQDRFIGILVDAIRTNPSLSRDVKVYVYKLLNQPSKEIKFATIPGYFYQDQVSLKASSITFVDFASLESIDMDKASLIEEFLTIIIEIFKKAETSQIEPKRAQFNKPRIQSTKLFMLADDPNFATANMLALIPLLADNLVRYEGVGKSRNEKRGLHRTLVDRGIDARVTRILRRLILSNMGWRVRTTVFGNEGNIITLDDSRSIVKVSPVLKNPDELACLLEALVSQLPDGGSYPWRGLCKYNIVDPREDQGLDISEVVKQVDNGFIVILDVSGLENVQADLAVLTIMRRIFEERLDSGVEESRGRPVISIVSEEAPLYLSGDRVRTPFNPFARIAREGRKFNIGLVAISQLASMIERQILGNFNTIIAMRTKSSSDLSLLRDIGISTEALPYLGDRECFLYTPDLPIKEPIPVYIPAWFDEEYIKVIMKRREKLSQEIIAPRGLTDIMD